MNKYKVCVYAICKNEEKFVKRWYESMKEADAIYVLDTGSTDNTVKLLRGLGVNVEINKIAYKKYKKQKSIIIQITIYNKKNLLPQYFCF